MRVRGGREVCMVGTHTLLTGNHSQLEWEKEEAGEGYGCMSDIDVPGGHKPSDGAFFTLTQCMCVQAALRRGITCTQKQI